MQGNRSSRDLPLFAFLTSGLCHRGPEVQAPGGSFFQFGKDFERNEFPTKLRKIDSWRV